ncbi:MAG: outer membrane lipoprotein carrier protein LolA [Rickettsiales bacterium]|nr:outer membrane lipoprotein carrier protein LolA [Rickettsiales bacterium]
MHKIVPIILCLMLALPVHAEERFAGKPYAADILKAEAWLNQMKTLQTRFMQTDPGQGMVSQGTLTMSRPGNARWEYLEPTHILVLVTGKDVIYYDYELDQISYGDLQSSLANLLLKPEITLGDDVLVTHVTKSDKQNELSLVLADKNGTPDDFITALTLDFTLEPFMLNRMRRTTQAGETISINLLHPQVNIPLDEATFKFENPRLIPSRQRR